MRQIRQPPYHSSNKCYVESVCQFEDMLHYHKHIVLRPTQDPNLKQEVKYDVIFGKLAIE